MSIDDKLLSELQRIVINCTTKRELLLQSAIRRTRIKKNLTISSGLLSLLSAGAITTVLVKYLGNDILQIIAAAAAALSGIFSLILTINYAEENTTNILRELQSTLV